MLTLLANSLDRSTFTTSNKPAQYKASNQKIMGASRFGNTTQPNKQPSTAASRPLLSKGLTAFIKVSLLNLALAVMERQVMLWFKRLRAQHQLPPQN